jgi:hypothetical protein
VIARNIAGLILGIRFPGDCSGGGNRRVSRIPLGEGAGGTNCGTDRGVENLGGEIPVPGGGAADKGTLFLDEIGDLSPSLQTRLLRLLQEGEYKPVGGIHFLTKYRKRNQKNVAHISPSVLQTLMSCDFPGNVRELENIIERAVIYCRTDTLDVNDLFLDKGRPIYNLL